MSNFNNGGQQFTPRKKTLLDDWRQPHLATLEPMEGGKYPATLIWQQKNNGGIVLKVNDGVWKEGAKQNHKEVEMGYAERGILFEAILEAANNPDFGTKQFVIRKRQFVRGPNGNQLSDSPITQGTFTVMRKENGEIHLGYSRGDYKPLFVFKGPYESVLLTRGDGERVEDTGLMSRLAARMWVNFHRPILDRMENEGWQPPKPRNNGNNNNGGNRGGNNYGSGSNSSDGFDSFDDDVDF